MEFPYIDSNVFIGINTIVIGNIKIGEDVLIALNGYVNFDISSYI